MNKPINVSENTKFGLDIKTLIQVGGFLVIMVTGYMNLKNDVANLQQSIDSFVSKQEVESIEEKVNKMYDNTSMDVIVTKLDNYDEKFTDIKDLARELRDIPVELKKIKSDIAELKNDKPVEIPKVKYYDSDIKALNKKLGNIKDYSKEIEALKAKIKGLEEKLENSGSAF